MSQSILHNKEDGTCYLCNLLNVWNKDERVSVLEEHHVIYGRAYRRKSEHYGLKVYLRLPHHRTSGEAVHQNNEMSELLEKIAQIAFEKRYGHEKWMQEFDKNHLTDEERERYLEDKGC